MAIFAEVLYNQYRCYASGRNTIMRGVKMKDMEKKLQQRGYKMVDIHGNQGDINALFNAIPIPTFAWQSVASDFILSDYNGAADKIGQGKIGARLGSKATEFYYDRPDIVENMRCCFTTHRAIKEERSLVLRTTGEEKKFAAQYSFSPPEMILLSLEDVTACRYMDEKLQKNLRRLSVLFEIYRQTTKDRFT